MRNSAEGVFFTLGLVLLLAGCGSPPKAVVVERDVLSSRSQTEQMGGQLIRMVQPGDTLYSIAFSNGLDPALLAAWNDIHDTTRLRIGQRIRLTKPVDFKPTVFASRRNNTRASSKAESRQSRPEKVVSVRDSKVEAHAPKKGQASLSLARHAWAWPTQGQIVRQFDLKKNQQGIDIKGLYGQPVKAAMAGEVVYAGSSLKGYGNLVILKHNDIYLSAYAHNKQILVKEGQYVAGNQVIADMGRNLRGDVASHFQIRKHGNPVNPIEYLPTP